jgi:F-type H+-transporting ATPase subunit b
MYQFAAENQSLFTALGLNLKTFLLNGLAFLVVVVILRRFVYPSLMKALDTKIESLSAVDRLKEEAQKALDDAAVEASKLVKEARRTSDDILRTTKDEAAGIVEEARNKAEVQAERALAESREQLVRDVEKARATLKKDMAKLVTIATETVIQQKLDHTSDKALIERSLAGKS